MLFSWPQEPITGDDGKDIDDLIILAIPDGIPLRKALLDMTKRTFPYALLLVETQEKELVVILESHHGTRSWRYPMQRRGDVIRLGEKTVGDNKDSIGILWRKGTDTI